MLRNVTAVMAALLIAVVAGAHAQSSRPQFEVASVKPNTSGSFSSRSSTDGDSGYFRVVNATLKSLILSAYRLFDFQLVGGPDWITTARFDIEAKVDRAALPLPRTTPGEPDVMSLMVQSLLEERFQVKTHRETRELPVFTLTVVKNGTTLTRTVEGSPGPGGLKAGSSRSSTTAAGTEMSGSGITIARLTNMLSGPAGRPIIDKTNLTGQYDLTLKFAPVQNVTVGGGDPSTEPIAPSLFTALQEQLGLKLESAKGPVEVLVIDSVSKPSEN
jgi:uncharacterized protein (TIGR03435 family)